MQPGEEIDSPLDRDIVAGLIRMLDDCNPLVQKFRMARDRLKDGDGENVGIRIVGAHDGDPVQYNLPTCDDLAILVVGDFSLDSFKRDIIVHCADDRLQCISSLHPALMALHYPLLFPYGDRGFQLGIPYIDASSTAAAAKRKVTMNDFYRYQFHYRKRQPNSYLCCGHLSMQSRVDARALIDQHILQWIANNQKKLRMHHYQGIVDAVAAGSLDGDSIGKRTYLPASHVGGRRYMLKFFHDAVAVTRVYGPTDLFETFTSNPKWPKIIEALKSEPGQKYTDRSDIVFRVYHMKLQEMLHDIKSGYLWSY